MALVEGEEDQEDQEKQKKHRQQHHAGCGGGKRGGAAEEASIGITAATTATTSGSSTTTNKKGDAVDQACINCRIRKVKCDQEQPACSRCIRKGVKCERPRQGSAAGGGGDFGPSTVVAQGGGGGGGGTEAEVTQEVPAEASDGMQLEVLRMVRDSSTKFREYAKILTQAVVDMQEEGRVDRERAIGTLRSFHRDNLETSGGDFDRTWGALPAIMSALNITHDDLSCERLPNDFPALNGLPRMSLLPDYYLKYDLSVTALCRSLDPAIPTMLGAGIGFKVSWMNEASLATGFSCEEVNPVVESGKWSGYLIMTLNVAPDDRGIFLQALAEHLFGHDLSTSVFVTAIDRHGSPFLRMARLRWAAVKEYQLVCTVLTYEEVPPGCKHVRFPFKRRAKVVESFREQTVEQEAAVALCSMMSTTVNRPLADSDDWAAVGASAVTRSSSTTTTACSATGGGGGGGGGVGMVLPMVTLGATVDTRRLLEEILPSTGMSAATRMSAGEDAVADALSMAMSLLLPSPGTGDGDDDGGGGGLGNDCQR